MAEERRCLGDVRVRVRCSRVDMGSNPLGYDHRADQGLNGHVSCLGFELQLPVVLVPHREDKLGHERYIVVYIGISPQF